MSAWWQVMSHASGRQKRQSAQPLMAARFLCAAFLRARGGIRTHDLRLRRATLYPAELLAQTRTGSASPFLNMVGATGFEPATSCSRSRRATGLRYAPPTFLQISCSCKARSAPGETRTPNLLIRSQMLYPIELRAPDTAQTPDEKRRTPVGESRPKQGKPSPRPKVSQPREVGPAVQQYRRTRPVLHAVVRHRDRSSGRSRRRARRRHCALPVSRQRCSSNATRVQCAPESTLEQRMPMRVVARWEGSV